MSFVIAGNSASTGYNLTRSLRFRASASAYLNRTPSVTGNRKVWTWSAWVKRGSLATTDQYLITSPSQSGNDGIAALYFSNNQLATYYDTNTTNPYGAVGPAVYRDPSAWYHIVWAVDAANSIHYVYVNGTLVSTDTSKYPPNYDYSMNRSGYAATMGTEAWGITLFSDLYLAEVNFIDGQALTPSSFGSTNSLTGVWQPARYTGTYGTNGFYLPFTDNSALTTSSNVGLGKDFSGNGNYWTTNNISITAGVTYDSMTDVPTLTSATAANFAVLNPLDVSATQLTLSDGNLTATQPSTGTSRAASSTFRVSTGKWYFEGTTTVTSGTSGSIGIADNANATATYGGYRRSGGTFGLTGSPTFATYTNGDVIGVAFDADAKTVSFYKNGTLQGTGGYTYTGSDPVGSRATVDSGDSTGAWQLNFGQRPFTYTPPTGFVALNTFNLPTSTIVKGNTVMDATLYTGTLLSNAITNAAAFKPDLVWLKSRSAATNHKWTDSVRGVTKAIASNSSAAETTDIQGLASFNSNGFTVGTNTDYNNLAATYVAWQWQAGQGSSSSNTNGTVTSTVSVNASAGFSVVTFSNPTSGSSFTFGHGLGVAPGLVIFKYRDSISNWYVYHQNTGNTGFTLLDTAGAFAASSTYFNNTSPSSSVVTLGSSFVSGPIYNLIAYCWAEISGFSKFGSFTGNGSTDGPFVYLGFRPKYVLIKDTTSAGRNWLEIDSARSPYNPEDAVLLPNDIGAESSGGGFYLIDMLSNGFKIRSSWVGVNASGNNLIYAAFAENPFKNSLAR